MSTRRSTEHSRSRLLEVEASGALGTVGYGDGKTAFVYIAPKERFLTVKTFDDLRGVLAQGNSASVDRVVCALPLEDLLVTNYSMLEYMLLRPIERDIFRETADYYAANRDQRLILILDEAHLYRGAQGTEVAMLIRRLRNRLRLPLSQLQVICASASFSDPDAAKRFAADLAGKPVAGFVVLAGDKRAAQPSGPGDVKIAEVLAALDDFRHWLIQNAA